MFDNPQQLKDLNVGLHRGFALITFENPKSALAALARRPHMIDNALVNNLHFKPYIFFTSF